MSSLSLFRSGAALAALLVAAAPAVRAQGAVSNQGFGYPTGQLSPVALAAGGSSAEVDPASPINPASIAHTGRYVVMFQFEPEFRTTKVDGTTSANMVMRFPTFAATGRVGPLTVGASVSTFLDRTWVNSYTDSLFVAGEWHPSTALIGVDGAISDTRLAVAYAVHPRLRLGVGLHAFTGENQTQFQRIFTDTAGLGGLAQTARMTFSGRALSGGVVYLPRDGVALAASFRSGGDLTSELNGVHNATAQVPARWGLGGSWLVVPGATLNARVDQTRWTDLDGLGTSNVFTFDATEIGVGADVVGPRVAGVPMMLRVGLRDRTLPFGVNGDRVPERSFSFGAGLPVARGRAQLDVALQRAVREVGVTTERSWFLSVGIGIRP